MSMPLAPAPRWTAAAVQALPDSPGERYECVDGALLVTPSPSFAHQSVAALLYDALRDHCDAHGVGACFFAPFDIVLDPHTLVQPDLFVLPLVDGRRPRRFDEARPPLLFVEILSPATARHDRVTKRARYVREGVEYWIADLEARLIERWRPGATGPEIIGDVLRWQPDASRPALELALAPLFERALGTP